MATKEFDEYDNWDKECGEQPYNGSIRILATAGGPLKPPFPTATFSSQEELFQRLEEATYSWATILGMAGHFGPHGEIVKEMFLTDARRLMTSFTTPEE